MINIIEKVLVTVCKEYNLNYIETYRVVFKYNNMWNKTSIFIYRLYTIYTS